MSPEERDLRIAELRLRRDQIDRELEKLYDEEDAEEGFRLRPEDNDDADATP